ncbi:hypothetical protein [Methylobacterium sp. Leaf118]|uniref:hypothetical protein n=1 Tax=Methylobacterium sp. Leaf118 TaxID=2876562 RepID=UPI001E40DD75|nr:hypothetical protein [Methylobacterium sp. Leaf118]
MFGERDFAERVMWRVPVPVPPTSHGFEDRPVSIVDGARVVGVDNERGKGDHRHVGADEWPSRFTEIDRRLGDFVEAVEAWRRDYGKGDD